MPFPDGLVPRHYLLVKGQHVALGNHCLADVLMKWKVLGLVQDGKGDLPRKWPIK